MGILSLHYNVVVLYLVMFACHFSMCRSENAEHSHLCIEKERQALFTFKQSVSDRFYRLKSWTGPDCCSWEGVACDNKTGHVIVIELAYYELVGSEVSPSLAELKYLETLDLRGNDFSANTIPSFFGEFKFLTRLDLSNASFAGIVPPSLGNLSALQSLDLSGLNLLKIDDLNWLSKLSNLTELDLSGLNLLKIDNLNWLSKLSNLWFLDLSSIDLSQVSNIAGTFSSHPSLDYLVLNDTRLNASFLSSLSHTNKDWEKLDLSYNRLSPTDSSQLSNISFSRFFNLYLRGCELGNSFLSYANLTNVAGLDLSFNSFSGSIPSSFFTKSSRLQFLDLSSNRFNGSIPDSIGQFSNMRVLFLSDNFLSGTIPESIGRLSTLDILDLRNNFLSGLVSEIHFEKLSDLRSMLIGSNHLTMNMSTDWAPPFQLDVLDMGSCKFENGFPQWFLTQKSIFIILIPNAIISGSHHLKDILQFVPVRVWILDLSNCSISGSIPQNIGNMMTRVQALILSHNNISGSFPKSLCEMSSLRLLDLANNHLSSDLPKSCWSGSEDMSTLDLSFNHLTGLLPRSIGNMYRLTSLHLGNNKFFGELPKTMENCKILGLLDLANNEFSGNLPAWMKGLFNLRILNMRSNKFDGNLSLELCSLSLLQILNLADNNFTGTIPLCFGNFSGMISDGSRGIFSSQPINYRFSYLERLIQVMKGRELEYTKTLGLLVNLDLSSNNLVGSIPEELTLLSGLYTFNLSHNNLTGFIPYKIGNLKSLESLDLAHNHLTGTIPQSISEITSLASLNLSYNNLSGKIPTGKQLQTLNDRSIYEGNNYLCGKQIEKECREDEPFIDHGDVKTNEESDNFLFYMGVMAGTVFGFWGVCGVLFFKKSWRYIYFRFVEDVYEMIPVRFDVCATQLKNKFNQQS